jgi:anti-anti-sigma regulatory factor
MFDLNLERVGDVAVILCQGRMVRSDTVFKLRDTITGQRGVRAILLDLSELQSISGGGVGMLVFLREWARYRGIQLWLFDPPPSVRKSLTHVKSAKEIKVASMGEVMELLDWEGMPGLTTTKSKAREVFEPSAA